MLETIHIYHTNDVHSHLDYWPRTEAFLTKQKKLHEEKGESCFILDIGDFIDRSHIYTEATLGQGNVKLLNNAHYDAVTIGNNEGITLSKDGLNSLYNNAQFDVIVGNLKLDGQTPSWAKPYTIYQTAHGTKIGVVAATAEFKTYYEPLGWSIDEPLKSLQDTVETIHSEVDLVLCMSHLGIHMDEQLAVLCPKIDVIFGSHTHHVLQQGKVVGKTLLTGGGKYGTYVGHTEITYNQSLQKMERKDTELQPTTELPAVKDEKLFNTKLIEEGKSLLNYPVFIAEKYLNKEWFHHSALSRYFAEALLEFSQADCALFNAGIFLRDLPKGEVTAFEVHQCLPHPINACVIEISGNELKQSLELIDQSIQWPYNELKGLGFRGVVLGKMLTYGCSLQNGQLYINGEKAADHKVYKLATLDMFTFGFFFPEFKKLPKTYLLPQFLRDILILYGKKVVK
ncbi:bifunctional metallophosphatase/5'-nucleotidase [Rummeliibacillus sp. BSL5]